MSKHIRIGALFSFLNVFFCLNLFSQAEIKFFDSKKNFGFVKQGKEVELKYEFKNTGNQPLLITDYKVECSCTNAVLPKEPVLPGKSSVIIVHFDTKTAFDRQDRVVEIISNAKNSSAFIRFKGVVLK